MESEERYDTLFRKFLEDQGMAKSRTWDMKVAVEYLHKALCRLDSGNLEVVAGLGGVQDLLERFSEVEEVRNVGKELRDLEDEINRVKTVAKEELPKIVIQSESGMIRGIAEERLKNG